MDNFAEFVNSPLGMLSVAGVTFALGWLLFGADTRIEERRRRAIEFARKLSAIGFKKLPAIFEDYAVGDYSGMFRAMKELHDVMHDPAQRQAELEQVFKLLLEEKFRDPAQKQALLKLVSDMQAATTDGRNPLESTGQLAKDVMDVIRSGELGNRLLTATAEHPSLPNLQALDGLVRSFFQREPAVTSAVSTPTAG
jgi:hypothetical protein